MDVTPEPLPHQHQEPQNAFETLLTRISFPLMETRPNARTVLEDYVEKHKSALYSADTSNNTAQIPQPVLHYPPEPKALAKDTTVLRLEQQIVCELFNALEKEDNEVVSLLVQNNLVTANTTDKAGRTPLTAAIAAGSTTAVKQLLQLGADPNAFGTVGRTKRTPLMLAASNGSLPIVKLLFEHPYSADDSLVAPDGQIALRLACAANHAPVVAYLPSRRGGGFLRLKTQHATSVARIKKDARAIRYFFKFIWWDIPKNVVVVPALKACKWSWANRKEITRWFWKQLKETPERIWKAGKEAGMLVKGLGELLWKFLKAGDVLVFVTLPTNMWTWAKSLGTASYRVMVQLLDCGELLLLILVGIGIVIIYIPRQCWFMVHSMGDLLLSGLREIQIWINPKA